MIEKQKSENIKAEDLSFNTKSERAKEGQEDQSNLRKSDSGQETINTNIGKKGKGFSFRNIQQQRNQDSEVNSKSISILGQCSPIIGGKFDSARESLQMDMLQANDIYRGENDVQQKNIGFEERLQYRHLEVSQSYVSRRVRQQGSIKEKQESKSIQGKRCECIIL